MQRYLRLAVSFTLVALACNEPAPAIPQPLAAPHAPVEPVPSEPAALVQRGHDPWVFRSVLDAKPRMLTAALRPDFWVAYDTGTAALYEIWTDGVNLDGAVYNTHHGPQPTTEGTPLLVNAFREPWYVVQAGRVQRPQVRYRGHRLRGQQLVLLYTLALQDGALLAVEESPEARDDAAGHVVLERTFALSGAPPDTHVELEFNALSVTDAPDVRWNEQAEEAVGRLVLQAGESTVLRLVFPPPAVKPAGAADPAAVSAAQRMAESDCAACHNPTSKAIGPSYRAIAQRYRTNPRTIRGLARKIREGGAYEWGEAAMVAHPFMQPAIATSIAEYILSTFDPKDRYASATSHPLADEMGPIDEDAAPVGSSVAIARFDLGHPVVGLPALDPALLPNARDSAPTVRLDASNLGRADPAALIRVTGSLKVDRAGEYAFRIDHDGAAQFSLREQRLIHDVRSDSRRLSPWASLRLPEGLHPFEVWYRPSTSPEPHLELRWQPPDGPEVPVPAEMLRSPENASSAVDDAIKPYAQVRGVPGDRRALEGVHPSFDLRSIRPHDWKPMVGGLDFLPDGRPVVSTWDARGAVYVVDNPNEPDPERIRVRKIAEGLYEPLGLKVVDGAIFVLQKHELTELVDTDGDTISDTYRTVSNAWGTTANFHEFAFGLEYRAGAFYATLSTAVDPGGVAMKQQHPDRGSVLRIARDSGAVEFIARGLRTPNGIGTGTDGELFVTDNQGDWLPANKLVHVEPGAFYGSRLVDPVGTRDLKVTAPVVWLPMDEISYSPSQPARLDVGPYRNQIVYGDVTYGGLSRIVSQQVEGNYQGCVLPFTQGLEAGSNRVAVAPDGSIYVGGIGNPADWGQEFKQWYGLDRLTYNGETAFEMLALRVHADGVELTFTEPLRASDGESPEDYALEQWRYVPTAAYGGPKIGTRPVRVRAVRVSPDRRRVFLETAELAKGHVLHVRLARPMVSDNERELWATEAWCTINALPTDRGELPSEPRSVVHHDRLSPAQLDAGYQRLFDGVSTSGWRDRASHVLTRAAGAAGTLDLDGADGRTIVTEQRFGDFELEFEWRAARSGRAAVLIRVPTANGPLEERALALTLGDDSAQTPPLQRVGGVHELLPPERSVTLPRGQYNRSRIVSRGSVVQHWLNGRRVVEYDTRSAAFAARLAASAHRGLAGFAQASAGAIAFKDYGARLRVRDVRIRPLGAAHRL